MTLNQFGTSVLSLLGSLAELVTLPGMYLLLGFTCIGVVIGIIFYLVGGR